MLRVAALVLGGGEGGGIEDRSFDIIESTSVTSEQGGVYTIID